VASPTPTGARTKKKRLLQAFLKAVSDLNRIHSAQIAALLNGEGVLFEDEFAEALARKENIKYALLAHQREHDC
jgi:hypothetical protein